MKRAVLALLIVLATSSVAAARVVMTPTIPRSCPSAESWDKVVSCVGKFGTVKVERELTDVKLISVVSENNYRVPGLYIYVHGKAWKLAGMYESEAKIDVESFQRITIAKHSGFRIDVGVVQPPVNLDPSGATVDVVQQKISVFCAGRDYGCTAITTSCDLFVNGTSRESFRGKLSFSGDTVRIQGDRTRTGMFGYCSVPEELQLGFDNGSTDELLDPMLKSFD